MWQQYLPAMLIGDEKARTVHALSDGEATRKLAAMRRYVTQYPTLTGPADALALREVHGYELTWRAGKSYDWR
jgi:hypothetical protein